MAQPVFQETANAELDRERVRVKMIPTDESNYKHRMNMVDRFARLIAFAGGDLSGYVSYRDYNINWTVANKEPFFGKKYVRKLEQREERRKVHGEYYGHDDMGKRMELR